MRNAWLQPIHEEDIITNLVYNDKGSDVSHVMVDGRLLVDDHKLTSMDEDAVYTQAQVTAEKVWGSAAHLFLADSAARLYGNRARAVVGCVSVVVCQLVAPKRGPKIALLSCAGILVFLAAF